MKTTEHCPDTLTLAKYFGGRMTMEEKAGMETHLAECDACLELFVTAGELLADNDFSEYEAVSETEALSAMKRWGICSDFPSENRLTAFFRRIYVFLTGIFLPRSPALVRSPFLCTSARTENLRLEKTFETFHTVIFYDRSGDGYADITVSVSGDSANVIRLTLESGEKDRDSRPFTEKSEIFERLSFGSFRLIIRTENMQEKILSFTINGDGIHES